MRDHDFCPSKETYGETKLYPFNRLLRLSRVSGKRASPIQRNIEESDYVACFWNKAHAQPFAKVAIEME